MVPATTFLATSGCNPDLSTLHPAGEAARDIAFLWQVLLVGATAIFLAMMGLLALAFHRRPAPSRTSASEGVWFWTLGLAFPIVTLSSLTVFGLVVGDRLRVRALPDLVTVMAEARQWEWSFSYADVPGRVTRNILHIPAGRPVDVEITSRDVVHSFWVPRLAGKLDALPGRTNVLRIEADSPGGYAGLSAEFSGTGYREHVFSVLAHDPAGWEAFVQGMAP